MDIKEYIITFHSDAKENSINGQKIDKVIKTKKIDVEQLKQKIKASIVAVALIASGFAASEYIKFENDDAIIKNYLNDNRTIVTENTMRTDDNSGYMYIHPKIAYEIANTNQDIDSIIYSVYYQMGYDKFGNMNEVMKNLQYYVPEDSRFKNISSFSSYLSQNGFVDENGQIDEKKYNTQMKEHILASEKQRAATLNGGIKK